MRQFSPGNLYKLVKRSLVSISVLSLILGSIMLFNLYNSRDRSTEICGDDSSCKVYYYAGKSEAEMNGIKLIGFGVLAPLLFFTGRAIFNYTFPIKPSHPPKT